MISEESSDSEDWSNDAENSALHHRNKLHFTIYVILNNHIYLLLFWLYFLIKWQETFRKIVKSYQPQTFDAVCQIIEVKCL